ncbi:MAG: bifunctional folylpolyglutamate synthase/dihydrofolate synthase [Bacteroidetes bacterium]|nr:bifunctional folylpolyglutamate synthase/dihydrofolate synthase [Bacteroidota bacterium]
MNYRETLDFLFAQLPMYQRIGAAAYKKDLTNTLALSERLQHPEEGFRSVHIAGTNGKGSTSHMIASILQTAGYKVGLYTSPHLIDFRERIRINGEMIPEENVIRFVAAMSDAIQEIKPSFFEITVAMAFDYFRNEQVDWAVIETGLGGRLDSTNILHPDLCVITNIGMDHSDMLGDTLQKIAFEKAGIIKYNTPVVIGEKQPEVLPVFDKVADEKRAEIILADSEYYPSYDSDLKGIYQKKNIQTVAAAINQLKESGVEIQESDIKNGLLNVTKNTGLHGRWERLQNDPKVICDTGHNAEGIEQIVRALRLEKFEKLHMVFGQVTGKDPQRVLKLLPVDAQYYFCTSSVPRALPAAELEISARHENLVGEVFNDVISAYTKALENAGKDDLIFVGGSTFVVADLLAWRQTQSI